MPNNDIIAEFVIVKPNTNARTIMIVEKTSQAIMLS